MSYTLTHQAIKTVDCFDSASEKLVFIILADFANDKNEAFPSYQTIASLTKLSRQTVITTVKKLINKGLLKVTARFKNNAVKKELEQVTNIFKLCSKKLQAISPESASFTQSNDLTTQSNEMTGVVKPFDPKQSINISINHSIHSDPAFSEPTTSTETPVGGVVETVMINQPISNQPTTIEYLVSDEDKNKPVQSNPPLKDNYQFNWKTDLEKINLIKSELMDLAVKENEAEIFAKRLIQSNKFKRAFRTELNKLISNIKQGAMNYQVSANRIVEQANLKNWHSYEAHWGVYQEQKANYSAKAKYDVNKHDPARHWYNDQNPNPYNENFFDGTGIH